LSQAESLHPSSAARYHALSAAIAGTLLCGFAVIHERARQLTVRHPRLSPQDVHYARRRPQGRMSTEVGAALWVRQREHSVGPEEAHRQRRDKHNHGTRADSAAELAARLDHDNSC
jgi:hypothetical protein